MGIVLPNNIKQNKGIICFKCNCFDSSEEIKSQKEFSPIIENNINNQITFEDKDKTNSIFSNQLEKKAFKDKFQKILLDKKASSITNASKTDLIVLNTIKLQSYIRGYLSRKKLLKRQQNIIFNMLNNSKVIKEKDSEYENIDTEDNLFVDLSMKGTIFTGEYSCTSSISLNSRINKFNSSDVSRFSNNDNILSFNLKSKNNIKYKYYGFLKSKNNKQNCITTSTGVVKNSSINDDKVKNGFGKLLFSDNSIFKCNFNENKACGIGQYIDSNNNEEFIGEYKNNLPNGFGIYRNITNERKCMGYFRLNVLSGIGIEESIEEGYTYYGEFDKNQKHGYGVLHWKDGVIYEGQFNHNQMSGYAIIRYKENRIYKGQVINGKMEGFGEFDWNKGKKYFGYYKSDKKNGFGIYLWNIPEINDGEKLLDLQDINGYIGFFSEGKMNGVGMRLCDGKIKHGFWKNGVKMDWIEEQEKIKLLVENNQKKYLKIIMANKKDIINLLSYCAVNDGENLADEIEYIIEEIYL